MTLQRLTRLKPGASPATHLVLAALMWTVVGSALILAGGRWLWIGGDPMIAAAAVLAVAAGAVKSRLALDRVARRTAERIVERGDGRCIGGFLSPRSWLLVAIMAGGGRWLRSTHVARPILALVYVAVGVALLLSSRILWSAWSAVRGSESTREERGRPAPDSPQRPERDTLAGTAGCTDRADEPL